MKIASALVIVLASAMAQAADISPVAIGETWTYKRTVTSQATGVTNQSRYIFKISHKGPGKKYLIQSNSGQVNLRGKLPWRDAGEVDTDACLVDFFGGASLGLTNTCSTNFETGMDWVTEQVDKGVRTSQKHVVNGREEITVGAGTFNAIKITSQWEVAQVPSAGKSAGKYGPPERYHFVYWYVPAIKSMARVEREFRTATGQLQSEVSDELQGFRVFEKK